MEPSHDCWLTAAINAVDAYRRMIDQTIEQLTDEELQLLPSPGINSVAIILRHIGGNLKSRWTDFLTTDGEKDWRNRDEEFEAWQGDRLSLIEHFEDGWKTFRSALDEMRSHSPDTMIEIRGEKHTLADAVFRAVNHIGYHTGQITMIARIAHKGEWKWLTIPPGKSGDHNAQTWGTSASRGAMGSDKEK